MKISRWNIRRTVFQYLKIRIASTENSISPIAVPVRLKFLLCFSFLITFFGLPIFTIAGATLMGTFVTSIAGVVFYQFIAPYYPNQVIAPDWGLGILFGIGGFAGIYFGARFQKFFPAKIIKWILVGCILLPAIYYIWQFIS